MTKLNSMQPKVEYTNSLVIIFPSYTDDAANKLYELLTPYGQLYHFSKLKSFGRCLAVFTSTANAIAAKAALEGLEISPKNHLRLYFSMHTPINPASSSLLHVPEREKLMLISPPGSPAIGWVQDLEQSPNRIFMDDSFQKALQEVDPGSFALDMDDVESVCSFSLDNDTNHNFNSIEATPGPALNVDTASQFSGSNVNSSDSEGDYLSGSNIKFVVQKQNQNISSEKNTYPTFRIENCDLASSYSDPQYNHPSTRDRPVTPIPKTPLPM